MTDDVGKLVERLRRCKFYSSSPGTLEREAADMLEHLSGANTLLNREVDEMISANSRLPSEDEIARAAYNSRYDVPYENADRDIVAMYSGIGRAVLSLLKGEGK